MGRHWDKPNTDLEPEKWKWLSKGNPEVMLHKSDLNHQEGTSLSLTLSLPVCLSTCTLFPLNELLLSLLSVSMEINFYTAEEPRPCHWLGFGALPAVTWPQSLVGNRNPATVCCRVRLPEIIATRPWGPETRVCNPVLVCVEKKLTKRQKVERKRHLLRKQNTCWQTHRWAQRSRDFWTFKSFIREPSSGSPFSSGQSFSLDPIADLSQGPPYVHTYPLAKMNFSLGTFG